MVADALPADATADRSARQASAFPRRVQGQLDITVPDRNSLCFWKEKKCLSNSYRVKNFEFMYYICIT